MDMQDQERHSSAASRSLTPQGVIDTTGLTYEQLVVDEPARFRVCTDVYTDPGLFEAEMKSIFEKVWVYVGHESEVRYPGDYRTSAIGHHAVIVARGEDERVRVFLNMCRHRGNAVCREDRGNSSSFRCPYHGWVYSNTGSLVGVSERYGYPDDFSNEMANLGLIEVPRLAIYRGLIFASLNPIGETLEEYLGEVRKYVDLWADLSPLGTTHLESPHKYSYPGNWKYQLENGTDGQHARHAHRSAFQTFAHFRVGSYSSKGNFAPEAGSGVKDPGSTRGFAQGHAILERPSLGEDLGAGLTSDEVEHYKSSLIDHHGPERTQKIMQRRYILIFPNVLLMDANVRVIHPVSVDNTIVYSFPLYLDGVSESINQKRLLDLQRRLGTSGLIGTDDLEMFAGNQSGMRAGTTQWLVLDRGIHREVMHEGGEREGHYADEVPQRSIHRYWRTLMANDGHVGSVL